MSVEPWQADASSLVDAFRSKQLSPVEALEASVEAIEASPLNCVSYVDIDRAREAAERADISLPFGGVPIGVKELDLVEGWPATQASLVFRDMVADMDCTMVSRLRQAGAVPLAQTTASEFGATNCTSTRLHGATRNPWDLSRTPGGSSGGSAAAVAGGLLPLCTGSDGGGSIRIPAGFTGLFGLKATFGRIPRGPRTQIGSLTTAFGCLSRSVRDVARFFDVCNGFDRHDTLSLSRVDGWERDLGAHDLSGLRVAVAVDLGVAVVREEVASLVADAAEALIAAADLSRVGAAIKIPNGGIEWALSGSVSLLGVLQDRYPECSGDLTPEVQFGLNVLTHTFDARMAASIETLRMEMNEVMANIFDEVDLVICSTNPDVAFVAEGPLPTSVGGVDLAASMGFEKALVNNAVLTIPANMAGNPAITLPVGLVDGLPVGMQVIGRHHQEQLLLDLALAFQRERPWSLPPRLVSAGGS